MKKKTPRKKKFSLQYDHPDLTTLVTFKAKHLNVLKQTICLCGILEDSRYYGGVAWDSDAYYWIPTKIKHIVEALNNEV